MRTEVCEACENAVETGPACETLALTFIARAVNNSLRSKRVFIKSLDLTSLKIRFIILNFELPAAAF
jgi:hypothetical protein